MLKRKLFRDVKKSLSQFITIFLMVFLGVLVYSGIRSYMGGMTKSADKFYKESNLQDLNVIGKNFKEEDISKIKDIKHVKNAERKLTLVANQKSKEDKTLQLNFIESNDISKFYVIKGKGFDKNKSGVWLDNFYAEKNNLTVGDKITIKYQNREIEEEIIGLINVPDHVYDIKDESVLFPTHEDYGFAYLSINEFKDKIVKEELMEELKIANKEDLEKYFKEEDYDKYVIYNNVIVDVDKEENKDQVKENLEDIKSVMAVIDIKDSVSYSRYQGEIEEGETYVGIFSGLFLLIAVLSVITTMTRVVKKQRVQIGTLKALGFKKSKITLHYVEYGLWISLIASSLALIAGPLFIGNVFINMEMEYFQVPNSKAVLAPSSILVALLVVITVSLVTYLTTRKQLKSSPAETLRNKIPKVNKKSLNITNNKIFSKMRFSTKWNIRDIIRNKIRTIMGIVGITSCCMILVCAFGMLDTMNNFISWQFDKLYNFKYKISLEENYKKEDLDALTKTYGKNTTETFQIEVQEKNKKEANNILVTDAGNYIRFTDKNNKYIKLKDDGVYITEKLAKNKNYKIGDTIKWHIYGEDKYYESKIIGFDKDPQNQNLKMTKNYLESLGIEYKADSIYTNKKVDTKKQLDGVKIIQDKENLKSSMSMMLNTMKTMIILLITIAALLGSVIIYNLGILSFTEKKYQFATLKVLGFKNKQIKKIYIKQNNWITIISIIIGLPLGFYMIDFIFKMALAESYDMSAHVRLMTYIYATIGTIIVSLVVSNILATKVKKIDMVTSLKGNE